MHYPRHVIADSEIPRTANPLLAHAVETYASETNKVASVWHEFQPEDMPWRPHGRSSTVEEIMRHQLLSERRFFGEFLGSPEPAPERILPAARTPDAMAERLAELARPRLGFLAAQPDAWWLEHVRFFDVERERIWVFWRRVLHTAHHRTQLTVYLRLMEKKVVATYGPTADVRWDGVDPTLTVEAAGR